MLRYLLKIPAQVKMLHKEFGKPILFHSLFKKTNTLIFAYLDNLTTTGQGYYSEINFNHFLSFLSVFTYFTHISNIADSSPLVKWIKSSNGLVKLATELC